MKQRLLILAAATAVAFAACNGGNNEGSYSQAQVDSIAKAKEDSITAAMKLQTDSIIAAQALRTNDSLRIADSIANATTKGASATNVKKNSKPTKPAPPKEEPQKPKPETIGNGKPKAGTQDATTIGNGKPKAGTQNAKTIGNGKPRAGNQDQQ